jgi:tetratricopeptide (TPR) repeat protein
LPKAFKAVATVFHPGKAKIYFHGKWEQPVKEIFGAFEAFAAGNEKYSRIFSDGIIESIPRGSIYFGGNDPGRFLITAMQKSQVDGDPFFTLSQNELAGGPYLDYLRSMYGGKIYTPTDKDAQKSFENYTTDVATREQNNQLKPGEDVHTDTDGRVQISGHVGVMEINGLLAKIVFDQNSNRDFFVVESFPLDWMYPYLEPHGLIMKINRQPLSEISDEIVQHDRAYWTKLTTPMIGGWLKPDTSLQEVAAFAEKIHVQKDFSGFTGDPQFVQNAYSQKMFSKERSAIGGLYMWRVQHATNDAERKRMDDAADFAFKQAFAICPYSPETVYRYINFLLLPTVNRLDDALLVVKTCQKLDPFNGQITDLLKQLEGLKQASGQRSQLMADLQRMETEAQKNPTNFQNILTLCSLYQQMHQAARVTNLLQQTLQFADQALADPNITYANVGALAQICAELGNLTKLEPVLHKLIALAPGQPEPRFDLAALECVLGSQTQALQDLKAAVDLSNQRLAKDPSARDIVATARTDPRLDGIRSLPEFQKLVPPK